MSSLLDACCSFAVWWREGLTTLGTHLLQAHSWPEGRALLADPEADREAWEEERARLALSPWWL